MGCHGAISRDGDGDGSLSFSIVTESEPESREPAPGGGSPARASQALVRQLVGIRSLSRFNLNVNEPRYSLRIREV